MLGRSHALSGAVAWVAACAAAEVVGVQPEATVVLAGAVVAAGAAILPDIDCPGSTVARSLGPVTGGLAWLVSTGSGWVRRRTCSHCRSGGGHRAFTHTAVFAVALGGLVSVAGWLWGPPAAAIVAALLAGLGVLGLRRRKRDAGLAAATVGVLAAGAVLYLPELSAWWWLGLPVALGVLLHSFGDALTKSGVPVAWPLRIRGCRWQRLGTPRWLRFRTGGAVERVVWWVMVLGGMFAGWFALGG